MSLVLFEDILKEQIDLIPAIDINSNVSRKPSFGWGDTDALKKFLAHKKETHNPLVWSVPRASQGPDFEGIYTRVVELNLCCVESDTGLLNEVRLNPDKSFKKVLLPLWDAITRRFELSDITMTEELPEFQLFPDYKLGDQYEAQWVWDVMKFIFTVNYSSGYSPCNS